MLLYEGSGKDKISDLTVNLIKEYLLEYTQTFALKNIREGLKSHSMLIEPILTIKRRVLLAKSTHFHLLLTVVV